MENRFSRIERYFARHFVQKRLAELLFVLLGVTFLTFIITAAAPSDAAEMYFLSHGITPSETLLEQTRQEMGLNAPVLVRYFRWLGEVLTGDLGVSYQFGESVFAQLSRKLPATVQLASGALAITIAVAVPLGVTSAIWKGRMADWLIRLVSFVGISLPNFWLALILLYYFGVVYKWFPVISGGDFRSMVLPALTLAIPLCSGYVRQIRVAVLEQLGQEYVTGARARGIPEWKILIGHVLPGALAPIVTMICLSVGNLLGGAAIVETVFGWPGIGSMVVDAIRVRDYPVIQGYVIWMAVIYLGVSLLGDAVCRILDPQLRRKKGGYVDEQR